MSFVIKSISLEASFLLVIYLVVSVVRTRAILDWLVKILVSRARSRAPAPSSSARMHYNIFNHEHLLLPIFHFNEQVLGQLQPRRSTPRPGVVRTADRAQRRDGHAGAVRDLSGRHAGPAQVVRRGAGVARWRFRRRLAHRPDCNPGHADRVPVAAAAPDTQVLACPDPDPDRGPLPRPGRDWRLVSELLSPGRPGGFGAERDRRRPGRRSENTSRLSRWGPELHAFANYNPLFGEGFGTRINGRTSHHGQVHRLGRLQLQRSAVTAQRL